MRRRLSTTLRAWGSACGCAVTGQDARAGAFAAEALFKETYPGIMVYPVYENPYFKVVVGNCLTAEEAIILKGKIASTFPKAFVKSEEFSMADLLN